MRSDLLQQFHDFSQVTSIHGIKHAVTSGCRRFRTRLLWAAVVLVFASLCLTLQLSLFYEVLFLKSTTVENSFELKHALNMPNVVICDLNSEKDAFFDYFKQFGNTAGASLFFFPVQSKLSVHGCKKKFTDEYLGDSGKIPWAE